MVALEGVRVLDLTWSIAGPYCGQILADLGAEVIRVEHPGRAMSERVTLNPPQWDGERFSPFFLANNRNKRSLTLNLKSPDGRRVFSDLLEVSDVVIESYSAEARAALVDEEWAWAINPRIIWGSLSAFGRTGPDATRPGYDLLVQARSGMIDITGLPDGPPTKVGSSVTDYISGTHLAVAVLAALIQRDVTGRGQLLDVSMLEAAVACLDGLPFWKSVADLEPVRTGNQHPAGLAGYSVLETSDGYIAVAALGPALDAFVAEHLARPDLVPLPPWSESAYHGAASEVSEALVGWAIERTTDEVHEILESVHIMNEPVRTMADIWSDPQLEARGAFMEYQYGNLGPFRAIGSPLNLSDSPRALRHHPPALGEHNNDILGDLLGYDDEAIAELTGNGALWDW